jgi:O-antigen ligase
LATLTPRAGFLGTLAVAGAVFALAFNSGSYAITARCAVGVAVWWGLALALASGLLPLARVPRAAVVTAGFLGALMLLSGLSIAWSPGAETAFDEADRVLLYLGVFLLVALAATPSSLPRFVDGVGLGVVALVLLALVARLFPHLIPAADSSPYPGDPRATWPLDYWNGLAVFAALGIPSLLRGAVAARHVVARAAAVGAFPILASIIYLTSSRGGAGAALVAAVAFVALTRQRARAVVALLIGGAGSVAAIVVLSARSALVNDPLNAPAAIGEGHSAAAMIAVICVLTGAVYLLATRVPVHAPKLSRRAVRLASALAVVGLVAGVVAANPIDRFRDFTAPTPKSEGFNDYTTSHLASGSSNGRWQFWSAAFDQFQAHPVLGDGAGTYPAWWLEHGSLRYFTRNAHSVYLQTLGELGLVGLLLLVGALGTVALATVRRVRAGPAARNELAAVAALALAFVAAAGFDWMWQLPGVALLGVAALALLVGAATRTGSSATGSPPTPRIRWPWRAAILVVGAAAAVAQGIPLLTQTDIERSQAQAARYDMPAALASARAAQRTAPWAASPRLQLALVEEASSDLDAARRAIRAAIQRDSSDWRLWLVAARIANERGDAAEAAADLRRATSLNPRSPVIASFRRSLRRTAR